MRDVTPEAELPIWQQEALFPEKPPGAAYGYVTFKGERVSKESMEELRLAFSQEEGRVYGVWIPERPRVIPVAEAPELLPELKPRRLKEAEERLKSSRTFAVIVAGILVFQAIPAVRHLGWKFYESQAFGMMAIMAVIFGFQPFYEAWKKYKTAQNLGPETLGEEAREMRFEIWMSRQKAPFTKVLTLLIVGLSLVQIMQGGFHEATGKAGLLRKEDLNGETWRLWTAPFLHGGLVHILFNGAALWYLGKRVEVLAKWAHMLMVFISSALIGSFCSIHFLPEGTPGVGASGGIMGLLGFLLTFELRHPRLAPKPARRRLIASIVLMFVIGFIGVSFIDNAAHAGGLIAGVIYAVVAFAKSDSARRPEMEYTDWVIGVGSLIMIAWCLFFTYSKIQ